MPYLWMLITGGIVSFFNSWGIGANDCANSFATSVGSKVLTLKHALVIASVFEFLGAFLMGSHVTDTVRKKIVDIDMFETDPYPLMLGMMCANFASGVWLTLATYFKYPVSTTHSIIGAIVGFALAYGGADAIVWKTIGFIVLSWLTSPVLSGIFSYIIFFVARRYAYRSKRPFEMTLKMFPILTFVTFLINSFFIFYKGAPQLKLDDLELWISVVTSFSIAIFMGCLSWFLYVPYAKKKIESLFSESENQTSIELQDTGLGEESTTDEVRRVREINLDTMEETVRNEPPRGEERIREEWEYEFGESLYNESESIENNIKRIEKYHKNLKDKKKYDDINKLHETSEVFDPKVEKLCTWLQIITACFSSFAHGANDVANSVAPFATIYSIYLTGEVSKKSDVPIWILAMGGIGIVIGLGTWGYKIIERIGMELTKVTASRGFIIELAAALTTIIASRTEMPVSTTHCQVGSVIGCGLADGKNNIEWKYVRNIVFSWVITLPVTGLISAGLFSFAYYSP